MLVKFSSVIVAISKGTCVLFTDTPKIAFSTSKRSENGRFIVRFVGIPGLNKVYVPFKVIPISLRKSVAFIVIIVRALNKWMLVLLFLGKISAIYPVGIGGGGGAVILGQNPILLVRTNKVRRNAEVI